MGNCSYAWMVKYPLSSPLLLSAYFDPTPEIRLLGTTWKWIRELLRPLQKVMRLELVY